MLEEERAKNYPIPKSPKHKPILSNLQKNPLLLLHQSCFINSDFKNPKNSNKQENMPSFKLGPPSNYFACVGTLLMYIYLQKLHVCLHHRTADLATGCMVLQKLKHERQPS